MSFFLAPVSRDDRSIEAGSNTEEGVSDGVADEMAFVVDGCEIMGDDGREGVENGSGCDVGDVGFKRGDGGSEGDFLVDWVIREWWEGGQV